MTSSSPAVTLPPVPLAAPARQTAAHRKALDASISSVLDSSMLIMGTQHAAFEQAWAGYCGTDYAVGVANGTDALELALRALGVGPGAEVVTVANAGGYTSMATVACGARPVFADIDPTTLQLSVASLESVITQATAAVVATHLFGQLVDIEAIQRVCEGHGVPLVEDCAQAHGASTGGRRAGSFGRLATFSFYPTKNLGALGDGGAVVTDDATLAERLRQLRQYGWAERYYATLPGGRNSRLDEMQAAVLLAKLPYLDGWNARRREVVGAYRAHAGPSVRFIGSDGPDFVAHLAVAVCDDRRLLAEGLATHGIATAVHYPVLDYHQPALMAQGIAVPHLPHSDDAATRILTLPCFPELSDEELSRVCAALGSLT